MVYVTIIVMLALVQFMYFGIEVGRARGRHGVTAPAVTGNEIFERFNRAHQNTLEQLIVFIPAIFACGYYTNELLAAACGVGFLIGRAWYFRSYTAAPDTRGKARATIDNGRCPSLLYRRRHIWRPWALI